MILLDQWRMGRALQVSSEGNQRILWVILGLPLLAWVAVLFRCRRIYSRPRAAFWKTAMTFGVLGVLVMAALLLSFVTSFMWAGEADHLQVKTFLLLHTVGVMVIAYGWAKPQLETRFRDLATRPFEN